MDEAQEELARGRAGSGRMEKEEAEEKNFAECKRET